MLHYCFVDGQFKWQTNCCLLENVFFPEVEAADGELQDPAGILCDAFSGHFAQEVKDFTSHHDMLKWLMIDGGITPKSQPLELLVNKVCKGFSGTNSRNGS